MSGATIIEVNLLTASAADSDQGVITEVTFSREWPCRLLSPVRALKNMSGGVDELDAVESWLHCQRAGDENGVVEKSVLKNPVSIALGLKARTERIIGGDAVQVRFGTGVGDYGEALHPTPVC